MASRSITRSPKPDLETRLRPLAVEALLRGLLLLGAAGIAQGLLRLREAALLLVRQRFSGPRLGAQTLLLRLLQLALDALGGELRLSLRLLLRDHLGERIAQRLQRRPELRAQPLHCIGAAPLARHLGVAELAVAARLLKPRLALVRAVLDMRVALLEQLDDDPALREEEEPRPLLACVVARRGQRVDLGPDDHGGGRPHQLLHPRPPVLSQPFPGKVRI